MIRLGSEQGRALNLCELGCSRFAVSRWRITGHMAATNSLWTNLVPKFAALEYYRQLNDSQRRRRMISRKALIAAAGGWLAVAGSPHAASAVSPARPADPSTTSSAAPAGGTNLPSNGAPATPAPSLSQVPPGSVSNTKNCGKGSNNNTGSGSGNQNNGNCPASP